MVNNLLQATEVARKHVQDLHPKRYISLTGEGYWAEEAWHVELKVGEVLDTHHYVLLVYPTGEIKQVSHDEGTLPNL